MKTTLILLVCSVFLMNSCKGNIVKESQTVSLKNEYPNDTLLINFQEKVMNAFVNAKISKSDKGLFDLEQALLQTEQG